MSSQDTPMPAKRGRPPKFLLSGIAVCGACGAPTRVGSQNAGTMRPDVPAQYRVYECAGRPGQGGFHVSMRQDHLDQIVTDAILERVRQPDFITPRLHPQDPNGEEAHALELEIKSHHIWLDSVRAEANRRGSFGMLTRQLDIVQPKIDAAKARLYELAAVDETAQRLHDAAQVDQAWQRLSIAQQRHIVELLVRPHIKPLTDEARGMRGLNFERVELEWLTA